MQGCLTGPNHCFFLIFVCLFFPEISAVLGLNQGTHMPGRYTSDIWLIPVPRALASFSSGFEPDLME